MKYTALFLSIILTVVGQVLTKIGGTATGEQKEGIINLALAYATSPYIIIGFGFYTVAALMFTYALTKLDYSFVSLASSLQYILVLLASIYIFKETISPGRWIGCGFILVGIFFVLRS